MQALSLKQKRFLRLDLSGASLSWAQPEALGTFIQGVGVFPRQHTSCS